VCFCKKSFFNTFLKSLPKSEGSVAPLFVDKALFLWYTMRVVYEKRKVEP
jgi:hypothetical protein